MYTKHIQAMIYIYIYISLGTWKTLLEVQKARRNHKGAKQKSFALFGDVSANMKNTLAHHVIAVNNAQIKENLRIAAVAAAKKEALRLQKLAKAEAADPAARRRAVRFTRKQRKNLMPSLGSMAAGGGSMGGETWKGLMAHAAAPLEEDELSSSSTYSSSSVSSHTKRDHMLRLAHIEQLNVKNRRTTQAGYFLDMKDIQGLDLDEKSALNGSWIDFDHMSDHNVRDSRPLYNSPLLPVYSSSTSNKPIHADPFLDSPSPPRCPTPPGENLRELERILLGKFSASHEEEKSSEEVNSSDAGDDQSQTSSSNAGINHETSPSASSSLLNHHHHHHHHHSSSHHLLPVLHSKLPTHDPSYGLRIPTPPHVRDSKALKKWQNSSLSQLHRRLGHHIFEIDFLIIFLIIYLLTSICIIILDMFQVKKERRKEYGKIVKVLLATFMQISSLIWTQCTSEHFDRYVKIISTRLRYTLVRPWMLQITPTTRTIGRMYLDMKTTQMLPPLITNPLFSKPDIK